jgi:uncharacterized membrane protein YgdD (TMEM256/DUF423 family)
MSRLEVIQGVASILGAIGVIAGAFGSHALKAKLEARKTTKTWDTAVKYHFIHTLALVQVGLWSNVPSSIGNMITFSFIAFTLGIILFSGSLYVLALGGPRWLGPVTPLGGLMLILGWIFMGQI